MRTIHRRTSRRPIIRRHGDDPCRRVHCTTLSLEPLEPRLVLNGGTVWDDVDSHKWIGEEWSSDPVELDWVDFDGRRALEAQVTSSTFNWAIMRTDAFPVEDWSDKTALRADVYRVGGPALVDLKLEVRRPDFDTQIQSIVHANVPAGTWHTVTWPFNTGLPGYDDVSHLSIVFDHLMGTTPTFYVDNMRLVTAAGEEEWDDMDDGSREWFYFGNWIDWQPATPFGLEPVTHNGANPTTPAGSLYLEWDYLNGPYFPGQSAEIGTARMGDMPDQLDGPADWSSYTHVTADVKVSNADVPISVFLWDADAETGFGTPVKKVHAADTWDTLEWDLPWPPSFDSTGIDEIKFVVNDIHEHNTGTMFLDNITLHTKEFPTVETGVDYAFAPFDRETLPSEGQEITDFGSNWGELFGEHVMTTVLYPDPNEMEVAAEDSRGALQVHYALPENSFTGAWFSLWGHSDRPETKSIDFTDIFGPLSGEAKDFDQIQFWVRGSGLTDAYHNVKIELKDNSPEGEVFDRTAYRYITIDDSDTTWRQIVLDADVTNSSLWSYNLDPPDPTSMKFMNIVVESYFNNPFGTFYIDNIKFVDADDTPFDPAMESDDAFLDLVSQRAFQYFVDWYEPNTGLSHDRSEFPDLMSIAATGFGLTALTIGEERGWIDRPLAIDMVTQTLTTLWEGQSSADTPAEAATKNGYKGFFYHFLDEAGIRSDVGSELSSVDTALLVIGALTAKEHFSDVPVIVDLADQIVNRVEWDWMLDPMTKRIYHAWNPVQVPGRFDVMAPDGGYFSNYQWDYTTDETMLINFLALASPTHPVPEDVFYAWVRHTDSYAGHNVVHSWNGSFFTYFFAHLWIDFEPLGFDHPPTGVTAVDWWENSVQATLAHEQFAIDHADDRVLDADDMYTTYGEHRWGLTAADGPDGVYHAYGALPAAMPSTHHDGTIAPYGAGSGILFAPAEAIDALKHYYTNTELWNNRVGFGDAYNLDPPGGNGPWYNRAVFGIDNGPLLIALENHRTGFVWETIGRNSDIEQALTLLFATPDDIGVYRGGGAAGEFDLDVGIDGQQDGEDRTLEFGYGTDTPIIGDWNGDGYDEIGVHRNVGGTGYFILDFNGSGGWDAGDVYHVFGNGADTPIVGDWDGDGHDQIGTFRNMGGKGYFILDFNASGGWDGGDVLHVFGNGTDKPIIGDWNGNGHDQIGTFRDVGGKGYFILDFNASGGWNGGDVLHVFGNGTDKPTIGDWDGDGIDQVGTFRGIGGTGYFIQDYNGSGAWDAADVYHVYGDGTDAPIIGNWPLASPLMSASGSVSTDTTVNALTAGDIAPVVEAAVENWMSAVPLTGDQEAALRNVNVRVADLPGGRLGEAFGTTVVLDVNAAGHGWFVDATPRDNAEFESAGGTGVLTASAGGIAGNGVDLLSAVVHELGHVLGFAHDDHGVMRETLTLGTRHVFADADAAFDGDLESWSNEFDYDEAVDALFAEGTDRDEG